MRTRSGVYDEIPCSAKQGIFFNVQGNWPHEQGSSVRIPFSHTRASSDARSPKPSSSRGARKLLYRRGGLVKGSVIRLTARRNRRSSFRRHVMPIGRASARPNKRPFVAQAVQPGASLSRGGASLWDSPRVLRLCGHSCHIRLKCSGQPLAPGELARSVLRSSPRLLS